MSTAQVTLDALEEYIAKYSNWGRWGDDDELGAPNLITRAIVRDAARDVRTGRVVGLGLPVRSQRPADGRQRALQLPAALARDRQPTTSAATSSGRAGRSRMRSATPTT